MFPAKHPKVVLPRHSIYFRSGSLRSISLLTCQTRIDMGQHTLITAQTGVYLSAPALLHNNYKHVRQRSLIDQCGSAASLLQDRQ